VTASSFAPP